MFPDTPQTLLKKIAALAEGDDAAEWEAFVELYTPPLKGFIRTVNANLSPEAVEDAVQDVFVRLVEVLRKGQIDRRKGKFRAYLASMTRRLLIDRYREALVRPVLGSGCDAVDATASSRQREEDHSGSARGTVSDADPGTLFDARWRLSVRAAAIDHVLTKTAVSEQSKHIYRALQGLSPDSEGLSPDSEGLSPDSEGLSPHEIAARFGVTYDVVKQVKSRLDRAVAAVERQMLREPLESALR